MLLNKRISIFTFLKQIKFDITAILIYAIVVGIADQYGFLSKIEIPIAMSAIIGTALSLLLAFRTAQAYERWWEARIIWGAIVNDSRTLIRQVKQFLPEKDTKIVQDFAYRQIIWCYVLGESLRKLSYSKKVYDYVKEHKLSKNNIPNAIINQHSEALSKLEISDFKQIQIDSTLSRLCDSMEKCERIKNTVFPKSYSLLVHFFIYVFATLLPFGLDDKYVLVEIFLTALIPIIFIAIERTAIILQDPFENVTTDIPMTSLAITIEINIKELIGDTDLPIVEKPKSFYIM
ncbi:putative membrane protein [Flavobacterium succinicans]|uniref:Putative membrane protein n=1 Tax=Flavobacterium succinicans TaxID=29536 RepID=A0A1I4Y0X8_9FLAO|nr:bestrophin family ion channel [Flavobacterium succinicans]SFN31778.1 putative membrane protein [Flavobacterium succinicans]